MAILRVQSERSGSWLARLQALGSESFKLPGPYKDLKLRQRLQSHSGAVRNWLSDRCTALEKDVRFFFVKNPLLIVGHMLDNQHVSSHVTQHRADRDDSGFKTCFLSSFIPPEQYQSGDFYRPTFVCTGPPTCENKFYAATYAALEENQHPSYHGAILSARAVSGLVLKGKHPVTNGSVFANDDSGLTFVQFTTASELMELLPHFVDPSNVTDYRFRDYRHPNDPFCSVTGSGIASEVDAIRFLDVREMYVF